MSKIDKAPPIIDIAPGVGLAGWLVELAQVHSHIKPAVVEAEVAVMARDRRLLEDLPVQVGLHQGLRKAPVNGIAVISAEALEMSRVDAFAGDGPKSAGSLESIGP